MATPSTRQDSTGTSARTVTFYDQVAVSCAFLLSILFLELVRAHRADFWTGWTLEEVGGLIIAAATYLLGILAPQIILCRITPPRFHRAALPCFGCLGTFGIWTMLLPFWDGLRLPALALVGFLPLSICAFLLIATSVRNLSLRTASGLVSVVFVGGITASVATAYACILDPALRLEQTLRLSFVWMAFLSILVLPQLFWPKSRSSIEPVARGCFCGLAVILPIVVGSFHSPRGADAADTADSANPPIILITCDTMRADASSLYGGDTATPNLEQFGARGTVFRHAYSLAPWTLPSMNGMMASVYPPGLTPGAEKDAVAVEKASYSVMAKGLPMPAAVLRERGYATAVLMGNMVLGRSKGIYDGFDTKIVLPCWQAEPTGILRQAPFLRDMVATVLPGVVPSRPMDTTRVLGDLAAAFLRQHEGQRLFLWVHFMDPHTPYDPPYRLRDLDGPWPVFEPTAPKWESPQLDPTDNSLTISPSEQAYVRSLYAAELRYLDEALGRIAKATPPGAFTCLTGDHGEEFWEHGLYYHGHSLYNELVHVPLIMLGPGIPAASVDEAVSIIDIVPTIAEWAGIGRMEHWLGASLMPHTRGEGTERPVFAQATGEWTSEPLCMVVSKGKKLVLGRATGALQLYDLDADPEELNDLSMTQTQTLQEMMLELEGWMARTPATFDAYWEEGDAPSLPAHVIDDLKSFGYLQ